MTATQLPKILAPLVAYALRGEGEPCDLSTLVLPADLAVEIDADKTPLAQRATDLHYAALIRTDLSACRPRGNAWRARGVAALLGISREELWTQAREADGAVETDDETGEHLSREWVLRRLLVVHEVP